MPPRESKSSKKSRPLSSTRAGREELKHKQKFHNILSHSLCFTAMLWFAATFIACGYSISREEIDTTDIPLTLTLFGTSVLPVVVLLWFSYKISQREIVAKAKHNSKHV